MWGAKLMKMIKGMAEPERVRFSEEQLQEEHRAAKADMRTAKRMMEEAALAVLDARPDAELRTKAARDAEEKAQKRLANANAMLAAMQGAREGKARAKVVADTEARWQHAINLTRQRENAAERAQRAALELGKAWAEMIGLQQQILGVAPVSTRSSSIAAQWYDGARSAIEGQVCLASGGALCPDARGHHVLVEFRRVAIDLVSRVRNQHRQILVRENGKPVMLSTIPEGGLDGPAAA